MAVSDGVGDVCVCVVVFDAVVAGVVVVVVVVVGVRGVAGWVVVVGIWGRASCVGDRAVVVVLGGADVVGGVRGGGAAIPRRL